MRTTALLLACSIVLSVGAQERPRSFGARSYVTAIELMVDVSDAAGQTPSDLTPADFIVREDGVERKVIAVDYLGGGIPEAAPPVADASPTQAPQPAQRVQAEWQTVIWFDVITTNRALLHESVRDLKARAPELVAMGPVTVFYADFKPRALVTATRDANALRSALDGMLKNLAMVDRITPMRQRFVRDVINSGEVIDGESLNTAASDVVVYISEEARLVRLARTNMLRWLGRLPRRQPRMLLYVGGGFDLQPHRFYQTVLEAVAPAFAERANADAGRKGDQENNEFAGTLATEGWIVVAVGGTGGYQTLTTVETSGKLTQSLVAKALLPTHIFLAPQDPLEQYAQETGGVRVVHGGHLPTVLDRMRNRVRITYQVDREPDREQRKVVVESRRTGLKVKAPRWASSSTAAALMEVRALDVIENPDRAERGDLLLAAYAVPEGEKSGERVGVLKVRVDMTSLREVAEEIGATKVRFTVGFSDAEGLPSFSHHTVDVPKLAGVDELEWSVPYRLPRGAAVASIIAEELTTGAWGSVRVPLDGAMGTSVVAEQPAAPPPASWLTDERLARVRAVSEDKLIFVYERDPLCPGCTRLLQEAEKHPAVQRLASNFVLLVTNGAVTRDRSVSANLTGRPQYGSRLPSASRPASFNLVDAAGVEVMAWPAVDRGRNPVTVGVLADVLQRAEAAAPHVKKAADERARGKTFDAHLSTAWAFRQAGAPERAAEAYLAAIRTAKEKGDTGSAQSAEILLAITEATTGQFDHSIGTLRKIAAAPVSPKTEGEAWLALGQLLRASGKEREAAEALDRAARLASASPNVGDAVQTLLGTSERVVGSDTRSVRLLVPDRPPYSGIVHAQALARDPAITTVVFVLDGQEVANDTQPPFDAPTDLGAVPRLHELRAIARDAAGRVVGDDTIVLNDRHDEFWVRLGLGERRTATASVNPPSDGVLAGVEFFLDGRSIARRSSPPFTANIGETSEGSTLRVTATLADGRVVEDALLVGVGSELLEVREVELYVSVHDARGELVPDLDRAQFTVLEEGERRRITGFDAPGRAPFTVGLTIDSSSSMLPRMADVHESARAFLGSAVNGGNRAFVVDFDTKPKLIATTTSDANALRGAVETIRADGSTALYDALVFSLLQLQGVPGKRALIVLSDGRDEGSRYTLEDVARVARESGAAIYLVVLSTSAPSRLETLASESGGRVWELRDTKQLDGIYAAINRELRGQYRLSFRTHAQAADRWRRVEVNVELPDAKVRSASGFVPR